MRMRTGNLAATVLVLGLGLSLALSGCGEKGGGSGGSGGAGGSAGSGGSASGEQTEAAKPAEKTETPTASKTAGTLTMPGCDVMNKVAKAESDANTAGLTLTPPQGPIGLSPFSEVAGPAARAAMAEATEVVGCYYPVSMHNAVFQWVVEIPKAKYQALVETMRTDSFYSETTVGGITVFSYTVSEETMIGTMRTNYAYGFIGDVWIAIIDNASGSYTASGVDGVLSLNPWLLTADG